MRNALVVLLILPVVAYSQPTIQSANLPDAGDLLIQKVCTLTGAADLEDTGPDHTWTYDTDLLLDLGTTTETNCLDVNDAPLIYQIFFNNWFDPEHNANYCYGIDEFTVGTITFQDVYRYIRNSSDVYSFVGTGWTISGVPLPSWSDPVDVIYELPVQYGDNTESYSEIETEIPTIGYYKLKQTRTNDVDGWGTIQIWGSSFPVLRVRTEIEATDSVYIDFISTGFSFDRPLTVEYKWLCPDYKVPVLQVTTSLGIVTSVLTADLTVGVQETAGPSFQLQTNYATDMLTIHPFGTSKYTWMIYSTDGKEIVHDMGTGELQVSLQNLTAGTYIAVVVDDQGLASSQSFTWK